MLKDFISQVAEGKSLSQDDATRAFQIMVSGGATPAQIAAFLVALKMKGETVQEIAGAAITMRAKMESVSSPENTIDVCGTGGDAANMGGTLNVSTAVALVVAACGVPVAKHGNRSVSSSSGSADVLAALGVNIQAGKLVVEASLRAANICFMFAPVYHKAMRHVTPVRQELGLRTIFNLLGPISNPASPKRQLLGVYDRRLLPVMAEVLKILGSEKAWVVHGSDGMDELTINGISYVAELQNGEINMLEINPADAGLDEIESHSITGETPQTNAKELSLLLSGKKSAYRNIVLLNAAAALVVSDKVAIIKEGVSMAAEAIDSGRAKETLASLANLTNVQAG